MEYHLSSERMLLCNVTSKKLTELIGLYMIAGLSMTPQPSEVLYSGLFSYVFDQSSIKPRLWGWALNTRGLFK